jgi:putative membrane protein
MWSYHFGDYGCPFVGGFFNVLILVLFIVAIAHLAKGNFARPPQEPKKKDEAMELLRKRYAAGEINKEEFEQKKKDLEG